MDDWNDLRLVLAITRAGSLTAAAKALGHNHSTVFRWLHALEARMGVQLFDRSAGRYRPTEAGERMTLAAERVEQEAIAVDREVAGRDARLSGRLRITASETLAYRILNGLLAAFRQRHDGIQIELLVDNRQLDLPRREADIAIRATRPQAGDLFGRKIADAAWTIYASEAYLETQGRPGDVPALAGHRFIGWDGTARTTAADWLARRIAPAAMVYRSTSLINQLMAVKAGIGLALLPCYLGDPEADIRRVLPPLPELTRELWLITHADLRHTARIRAFFDLVGGGLLAHRALLEGREPGA